MAAINKLTILLVLIVITINIDAKDKKATSPNGQIELLRDGTSFKVMAGKQQVLDIIRTGVATTDGGGQNLKFVMQVGPKKISEKYNMQTGKRRHCEYSMNEYVYTFLDAKKRHTDIVFRLSNDGVSFRYVLRDLPSTRLASEETTYRIADGTRRWMQPWTEPYEAFFPLNTDGSDQLDDIKVIRGAAGKKHWGYPALIESSKDCFVLISEANIERFHSASSLYNDKIKDEYRVCPDRNDLDISGEWHSPWRCVIVGDLKTIIASTLITDMSDSTNDSSFYHPGVVSWIYWAYNHGSKDYTIVKKYIDMASEMKLPYVLIDAEWDEMTNGKTVDDAIRYAHEHGVKPILWYNSSTAWTNGAPGPQYRLNDPEKREREFQMLEDKGVAGVKIDFFAGDKQPTMQYCIDLLECAARHHLIVNFHGATIPRGWQRTYPNLMSIEAVYGAEWYNNVADFTARAARHNTILPFTRNVIGSMDYTPCTFSDSQHPHITTHAHELALTVVFESGLQHLADRPESYGAQPSAVRDFLSSLPTTWDDTRLISGYPGEYVALARKCGNCWYVGILNGKDEPQTINLDLSSLGNFKNVPTTIFADGIKENEKWSINHTTGFDTDSITLQPRGGMVIVIGDKNEKIVPGMEFLMELKVTLDAPRNIQPIEGGQRQFIPITGGTFEGPRLRGTIIPGGGDQQYYDNATHTNNLEAKYDIRTDDGVVIHVCNVGFAHSQPNDSPYFVTSPRFEAPKDSQYEFLNRSIFVCKPGKPMKKGISLLIWQVK
jgi:hypothetical protein